MAWNPNIPTVTNRVQDDLDAIRENFQHFDPLAQVVGELQAVSALAPVAGELQAVSELAPYVQAILDGRIVEMGSNSNGTYVRYESGKQECWGVVTTPYVDPQLLYTFNVTWPAEFESSPAPVIAPRVSSAAGFSSRLTRATMDNLSTTGARYHIELAVADDRHSSVGLTYYAVGAWK